MSDTVHEVPNETVVETTGNQHDMPGVVITEVSGGGGGGSGASQSRFLLAS